MLDLPGDAARIRSRSFQKQVKKAKSLVVWWKRKYGYSSNDERYTEATLTQIAEDALEELSTRYIQEFEAHDRETNEFLKKRALNPSHDAVEAERLAAELNRALGHV